MMSLVCSCVAQFNIGAMVYREEEGRGVRSGKLPALRKIELSLSSTLKDILTLGRETFFPNSKPPLHSAVGSRKTYPVMSGP